MKRSSEKITVLIALIALIVALLNWLAPFSPVGPSPFAQNGGQSLDTQTAATIALLPTITPSPITTLIPTITTLMPTPSTTTTRTPTDSTLILTMIPVTPVTQVSDKDGMTLLYVPASEFKMGAASSDTQANADEKPQHTVYLDAFWIDQTEVTNAMFKKFIDATSYKTDAEKQGSGYVFDVTTQLWSDTNGANWQHPRGPSSNLNGLENHPVVQVSWNDAKAYCQWAGGDLPTEAQWEKAARGTDGRLYPWGNDTPDKTRLNYNLEVWDTTSVGIYPTGTSPYGALDMAGNVWEWVRDWYDGKYYGSPLARNPENTTESGVRVLRGGSWFYGASDVRASNRFSNVPVIRYINYGFRCTR